MQTTTNIGLKTYEANDPTDWLGEFNYNMNKIDTAVGSQNDQIEVIEETASSAVTTANTASSTANTALTTANSKASIDDSVTSLTKTWSSSKINTEISSKASINDTTAGSTTTYSSNKIDNLVDSKASINDTTASSTTTYSSTKIDNLVDSKLTKQWSLLLDTSFTTEETSYTISNLNNYTDLVIELEHSSSTADSCFIPDTLFISGNRVVLNDFSLDNTNRYLVNIQYDNPTSVKIWSIISLSDYTIRIYGR